MQRRWVIGAALGLAAVGVSTVDRPAPPPPGTNPLQAEVSLALGKAYDLTKWGVRVPVEWSAVQAGRTAVEGWLATQELPDDVRGRIRERLASPTLLDELVPFALFLRETYAEPDVVGFDAWARTNVPRTGMPGLEHSMFQFAPPVAAEGGGGGIPAGQAATFVKLYDAIYLQGVAADAHETDRLACEAGDDALTERADRARPLVRELIASLAAGMEPGEIKDGVDHVLEDPATLEAITLSLVEFLDSEVCKHYRIFAARAVREQQLRAWLTEALLDPDRDDGWAWLRAHGQRHHAVHVVVDGLQGHLVAALARGQAHDPLLEGVVRDAVAQRAARPSPRSATPGPVTTDTWVAWAAENDFPGMYPAFARITASTGFAAQGISTTPTISVRNLPIAKTGAPVAGPGGTGIPNFHFVDRSFVQDGVVQGRPWYFYGNDALQLTRLTTEAGMKTVFARLEDRVTMSCGAQYDEVARYSFDSFLSLAIGEHSRDFGELRCVGELRERAANEKRIGELRDELLARESRLHAHHWPWEWYDRWQLRGERAAVEASVAELAALEPSSMPDYLLWYDAWPDHFAHGKGPFSDEIVSPTGEYRRLDYWLGQVDEAYRSAGIADETLFGMAGDHGLTPVYWIVSPEAEFIEGLAKAGIPLRTKKISSDEGEGPKLTNRLRPPSMKGYDLVVASTAGGNYMMDFFVDQDAAWGRQPVLSELRTLRTLGGKTVDVVSELERRLGDSLDYLVVRATPCDAEGGTIEVRGPRAGGIAVGTIERRGDRIWYGWEGADVLGLDVLSPYRTPPDAAIAARDAADRTRCLAADRAAPDTWCSESEWRRLTAHARRPDSVTQLAHLYDTDRAGTVNLFPRDGVGYNTKVPGRHAGESFHEKDAFVGIWGAPVTGEGQPEIAINGAVPEALYAWVSGAEVTPGTDGWGYPRFDTDRVR